MRMRRLLLMLRIRLRFRLARMRNPRSGRALLRRFRNMTHTDISELHADGAMRESLNGKRPGPIEQTEQSLQAERQPPAKPPRLIMLVRHGQTTFNVEQRLPGQLPGVALTEEGRRQAHQAAVALSAVPLSAVISSPLERASDTAEILARGWGLAVRLDPRLMDTDVARWAGRKIDEVSKEDPAWKAFLDNPMASPDGVESFTSVQQRVVAAVEDVLHDTSLGNYVVLVAHADVVKLIVAHYTGVPLTGARYLSVSNASLTALAFSENDPPHLLAMNWTATPGWLTPPLPKPQQPQAASGGSELATSTSTDATDAVEASPESERSTATPRQ